MKNTKRIIIISLCMFFITACSSNSSDLIKETDKYGNEVIEVDLNDLSEKQLEELKEDGILLSVAVFQRGFTKGYMEEKSIDNINTDNIIFDCYRFPKNHPYYGYFEISKTNPNNFAFDIEKIDKLLFELIGSKDVFRENDEEFHSTYEKGLDYGRNQDYDYENFNYVGINDNLLTYELSLIYVDLWGGVYDDLGKYNMYYRVMKYVDTDEIFLRYIDIIEK